MSSKKITKFLFLIYLISLIWIILFKMQFSLRSLPYIRNINLIPFGESVIVNGKIYLKEIIFNAIIFIPFGIFMSVLIQHTKFIQKVFPVFVTSLLLESMQYILHIGATDITDLITNTFGGILGILIFKLFYKIFKEKTYKIVNIISLIAAILIILLILIIIVANI